MPMNNAAKDFADEVNRQFFWHHTRVDPGQYINFGPQWSPKDRKWIDGMLREIQKTPAQKAEDRVRNLDIQVGDRVRLTYPSKPDPSTIEGNVIGVKDKNGQIQLRIEGFGKTGGGDGGQYVWFVAAEYNCEVLHRAYRWTRDDEILVEIIGNSRGWWEKLKEENRDYYRKTYESRVEKIKALLG